MPQNYRHTGGGLSSSKNHDWKKLAAPTPWSSWKVSGFHGMSFAYSDVYSNHLTPITT
jgi:hypothetical protein